MPSRPPFVFLLFYGLVAMGCEDLIGAEFGDYITRVDGDAPPFDGSSPVDAAARDAHDEDKEGDEPADVSVPPDEGGGQRCAPGEVHDIAGCSSCGRYLQTCNAEGLWDPPFCQQEPGACAPGTTEQRSCEIDGTLTATCLASCTWSLGTCLHSMCTPNQVEKQPCGLCGQQSRTCEAGDGGWKWTPFSACFDQKQCAPSQVDREGCGKCGTHSRVCDMSCFWSNWNGCQGEGPCSPGETEERGCLVGLLKQTRTCSERCVWGEWLGLCL